METSSHQPLPQISTQHHVPRTPEPRTPTSTIEHKRCVDLTTPCISTQHHVPRTPEPRTPARTPTSTIEQYRQRVDLTCHETPNFISSKELLQDDALLHGNRLDLTTSHEVPNSISLKEIEDDIVTTSKINGSVNDSIGSTNGYYYTQKEISTGGTKMITAVGEESETVAVENTHANMMNAVDDTPNRNGIDNIEDIHLRCQMKVPSLLDGAQSDPNFTNLEDANITDYAKYQNPDGISDANRPTASENKNATNETFTKPASDQFQVTVLVEKPSQDKDRIDAVSSSKTSDKVFDAAQTDASAPVGFNGVASSPKQDCVGLDECRVEEEGEKAPGRIADDWKAFIGGKYRLLFWMLVMLMCIIAILFHSLIRKITNLTQFLYKGNELLQQMSCS